MDQRHTTDSEPRSPGETSTDTNHLDEPRGGDKARNTSSSTRSPSFQLLRRSPHAKKSTKVRKSHSTPTSVSTIDHTVEIQSIPTGRPGQNVIKLVLDVKPKKHTVVACLFCRERKIACKRPAPTDQDQRCKYVIMMFRYLYIMHLHISDALSYKQANAACESGTTVSFRSKRVGVAINVNRVLLDRDWI